MLHIIIWNVQAKPTRPGAPIQSTHAALRVGTLVGEAFFDRRSRKHICVHTFYDCSLYMHVGLHCYIVPLHTYLPPTTYHL